MFGLVKPLPGGDETNTGGGSAVYDFCRYTKPKLGSPGVGVGVATSGSGAARAVVGAGVGVGGAGGVGVGLQETSDNNIATLSKRGRLVNVRQRCFTESRS